MDGIRVVKVEEVAQRVDIVVTGYFLLDRQ